MSNLGKWERWYAGGETAPYGDELTYRRSVDLFADCETVADWGCGRAFLGTFLEPERYHGVDGSGGFADETADLVDYRTPSDGIFLRHVLEHDRRWAEILGNAVTAVRRRLVVVLFTPMQDETREIAWNEDPGVPDIGFRLDDLLEAMARRLDVTLEHFETATQYGVETMLIGDVR